MRRGKMPVSGQAGLAGAAEVPIGDPYRVAAIDMGTVTTRLLVADVGWGGTITEVIRRSTITHLGEGLDASGTLSSGAVGRVLDALAEFAAEADTLGARQVEAVATSAVRDAANADLLLEGSRRLGVDPRVIGGEEEARLSFAGATYMLEAPSVLVADPGGGSTELIAGCATGEGADRRVEISSARSVDVGARRMTERFLASDPPCRAEINAAREWATSEFRLFFDALRSKPQLLVTLAGTATALAAIQQGLAVYDSSAVEGHVLTGADLAGLLDELSSMTLAERSAVVGLEPGRAPVVVAGTLIIETVLGLAGLDSTRVSERDILYGIVLDAHSRLSR